MADEQKPKTASEPYDIFIANSTYPEADGIFSFKPITLQEAKRDALVVLDTNTLLVPYTVSKNSLVQIQDMYRRLVKQKRLFIPGQAAREFARNRAGKLTELYQQFNRRRTTKYSSQGRIPLLDDLYEYQEVLKLEGQIYQLEKEYVKKVETVLDRIKDWSWDDPVSKTYRGLFSKEVVFDPELDTKEIASDLRRRQIHKLPPGYKDSAKEDQGVGDLLIWKTILQLAAQQKKSMIFVSSDQKPDWWCQSEGQALFLRYELVDEYRRASEGQTIHVIKFSELMELFGAKEDVVQEVRKEETNFQAPTSSTIQEIRLFEKKAIIAITDWLYSKYPYAEVVSLESDRGPDLLVRTKENELMGVEIKVVSASGRSISERVRMISRHLPEIVKGRGSLSRGIAILVVKGSLGEEADIVSYARRFLNNNEFLNIEIVIGKLSDNNKFVVIDQWGGDEN